jgi:regulator of sirC expression with transglutaminase-like and TPR domain
VDEGGRSVLVDPFHGGHVVSEEDCRDLVVRTTGKPSLFRRDVFEGASPRAMVSRLLLNLKRIYLAQGDYERALSAVERLLVVSPDDAKEVRDRGLLLAHLGRNGAAVADLQSYLSRHPEAVDAESVRGRVAWILRRMSEAN